MELALKLPSHLRSWRAKREAKDEEQERIAENIDEWRKRRKGLTWKVYVVDRTIWLRDELKLAELEPPTMGAAEKQLVLKSCCKLIADAARAVKGEFWQNIWNWFTGYDIERAWAALHAAQSQLLLIQSEDAVRAQLPEIEAGLLRFARNDPRRAAYQAVVKQAREGTLGIGQRRALRQVMERAFTETDALYGRIRGFRNALLGTTLFLVLAIALIAAFSSSDWLPLCAQPTTPGTTCSEPEVWQIYLVGGLGGLLAAVFALRRLQGFRGPHSLPLVQAALKIPTGALTGLLGALFVQNSVFDLFAPQQGNTILAYVALFGYAQEAFTRVVDTRAAEILAPVKPGSEGEDSPGGRGSS